MAVLHLEVKHIKIQHCPLQRCPSPQYNADCMGRFLHTRRWQKECVACMRLHGTIHKHPMLRKLSPKVSYAEYDLFEKFDTLHIWQQKRKSL